MLGFFSSQKRAARFIKNQLTIPWCYQGYLWLYAIYLRLYYTFKPDTGWGWKGISSGPVDISEYHQHWGAKSQFAKSVSIQDPIFAKNYLFNLQKRLVGAQIFLYCYQRYRMTYGLRAPTFVLKEGIEKDLKSIREDFGILKQQVVSYFISTLVKMFPDLSQQEISELVNKASLEFINVTRRMILGAQDKLNQMQNDYVKRRGWWLRYGHHDESYKNYYSLVPAVTHQPSIKLGLALNMFSELRWLQYNVYGFESRYGQYQPLKFDVTDQNVDEHWRLLDEKYSHISAEVKKLLLKYHPDRAKKQNFSIILCHEITKQLNELKKEIDDIYTAYKNQLLERLRQLKIFHDERAITDWLKAGGTSETLAADKKKVEQATKESEELKEKARLAEAERLRIKGENEKKIEKIARAKLEALDRGDKILYKAVLEEEQELFDSTNITPGDIRMAQREIRQAFFLARRASFFVPPAQQVLTPVASGASSSRSLTLSSHLSMD